MILDLAGEFKWCLVSSTACNGTDISSRWSTQGDGLPARSEPQLASNGSVLNGSLWQSWPTCLWEIPNQRPTEGSLMHRSGNRRGGTSLRENSNSV